MSHIEIEQEHVFSACCTLTVLSLENLKDNNSEYFPGDYLHINYKQVNRFITTLCNNLYTINSATAYLLEKNSVFPGHANFYQWHESFGTIMCHCPVCKKKAARIEAIYAEFHEILEFYEKYQSKIELSLSAYAIIDTAYTHLSAVLDDELGPITKEPIVDPIRHKIISRIRRDMGMPDDTGEERWRMNLILSNAYISFYKRNIINYSLSLLGEGYATLKNQLYGYTSTTQTNV